MSADSLASNLKQVTIFTDGAAIPNPGAGGYGVVLRFGEHHKELSGGFRHTTNNRMELMAVIVGLEALKERCKVTLHCDSRYIVDAIVTGAAARWRDNGWLMNPRGSKRAKNADLWERLLSAHERHLVEMVWVKGHAGIDDNERCDALAMDACRRSDLPADPGFVEDPFEKGRDSTIAKKPAKAKGGKMTAEGQPCRNCGIPVIKRVPKKKTIKPGQSYYYAWYLFCPSCKNMYMIEEAKQQVVGEVGRQQLLD